MRHLRKLVGEARIKNLSESLNPLCGNYFKGLEEKSEQILELADKSQRLPGQYKLTEAQSTMGGSRIRSLNPGSSIARVVLNDPETLGNRREPNWVTSNISLGEQRHQNNYILWLLRKWSQK